MAEVPEDIRRGRQQWTMRRLTLQSALFVLSVALFKAVLMTTAKVGDWPNTVTIVALISAIAWLVTMYFAMVDNAEKVSKVVGDVGEAIGNARGHG